MMFNFLENHVGFFQPIKFNQDQRDFKKQMVNLYGRSIEKTENFKIIIGSPLSLSLYQPLSFDRGLPLTAPRWRQLRWSGFGKLCPRVSRAVAAPVGVGIRGSMGKGTGSIRCL